MGGNALRALLNRFRWDASEQGSPVVLAVRVRRGGCEELEEHSFATVAEITARGVVLRDGTFLPFHRVARVVREGRTVWPEREGRWKTSHRQGAEEHRADEERLKCVQRALGYQFRRPELLAQALRHSSAAHERRVPSNERLEFLGDAALSHAIAGMLFTAWPDASEGQLTRGRAALVRQRALAEIAQRLGIDKALEVSARFRLGDAVLADGCEAVLGALLLDGGWRRFCATVRRLFLPPLRALEPEGLPREEPKSLLQELAQRQGLALPVYHQAGVDGPEHQRLYTFEVEFAGRVLGRGSGTSKRAAQQEAARAALKLLAEEDYLLPAGGSVRQT